MQVGDALQLNQRLSPDNFRDLPFLIQGGPLLLADGQVVLDGSAESFSAAFINQRAPRSVVGSDGEQLWLIALEGLDDPGPTLAEASELVRQLGLKQALNLDGGSSTSLRVETGQGSQGRGIGAAIHNGLGIVVRNPR
jgi:exopolysaccharide biosynthesis protein